VDEASVSPVPRQEHQEEMVGTWLAMATLIDELIEAEVLDRQAILTTLADVEASCRGIGRRHRAVGAVRRAVELLAEASPDKPRLRPTRRRAGRGGPQGETQAITAAE
jgi:hypothetical protein